ncbi:MAG TPA: hypothetical protein VNY32_11500 [Candidatus Acidoferrales bacterium]|nr:hypothetical protein [Candidatus Acidoferrales bacterium]
MGETNPVSGEALTKSVQGVLQLESGSVALERNFALAQNRASGDHR